ncbi:MAG: hypothetical protein NC099_06005 [Corallococcus sp.]|nr:hypothetical protein [Bacillota bacterium]MCM1534187.1 hypothetical protein [Corallococcus sp.]
MGRIFYSKKTSILFVVAMLILLLLICMLLITLTQMASMNNKVEYFEKLIDESKANGQATQELLDYMQTNDYVREWAERYNMISSDDQRWIEENLNGNN